MGNSLLVRALPAVLSLAVVSWAVATGGCAVSGPEQDEHVASSSEAFSVAGCFCPQTGSCGAISYSDVPGDGIYYVTTFTGGGMACGGVADGTWPYVADSARYGCGTKLLVEGGGKSCVTQVADCGPNRCVEQAASYSGCAGHFPVLDVSPMITKHLFGVSGSGWSDKRKVKVTVVPSSTPLGCPGGCKAHCEGSVIVGADCGRGDCGVYGATCADDSLGVRCVSVFCPPTGGKTLCLPDGHTIGTCKDGGISTGDCGAYGAICREDGGAHCVAPYAALAGAKGSDAKPDPDKGADYRVCAGKPVRSWFELRNVGHLAWTDEGPSGTRPPGQAVRLGTFVSDDEKDFPDPFTGTGRFSVSESTNGDVHFDGPDCTTKGCSRSRFEISGKAPATPGVYETSLRLLDEGRTWFGPTVSIRYDVVDCPADPPPPPVAGPPPGAAMAAKDRPPGSSVDDELQGVTCATTPGRAGGGSVAAALCLLAWAGLARRSRSARRASSPQSTLRRPYFFTRSRR